MTIKQEIIDAVTDNPKLPPLKIWHDFPQFQDVTWSYFRQVVRDYRGRLAFDAKMRKGLGAKVLGDLWVEYPDVVKSPDARVEIIARAAWRYNSGGRDTWYDCHYGPSADERARGLQAARESVEALVQTGFLPREAV